MNHKKSMLVSVPFLLLGFFLCGCSGTAEVLTTRPVDSDVNANTSLEKSDKPTVETDHQASETATSDNSFSSLNKTDAVSQQLEHAPLSTNDNQKDSAAAVPQIDPLKDSVLSDVRGYSFENFPMGYSVLRLKSRDAILVWHYDYLEEEPTTPFFLLLDAPTGTIMKRNAWSVVFTHNNEKLIYGRPIKLDEESKGEYFENPRDILKHYAGKMGVPIKDLNNAIFGHSCLDETEVVQPVVRNMRKGTEKNLSIVGGGLLGRIGRDIIGLPRPHYYEFFYATQNKPRKLDIKNGRWLPIEKDMRDNAVATLKGPSPLYEYTNCRIGPDDKKGDVLLTTRDKTLALVVVTRSSSKMIGGARLPKGWSGRVSCP